MFCVACVAGQHSISMSTFYFAEHCAIINSSHLYNMRVSMIRLDSQLPQPVLL
jgi:hypothetical protein